MVTQANVWKWLSSLPDFDNGPSLRSAVDRIKEEWDELDRFQADDLTEEQIGFELADILITVLATASLFGVDVQEYAERKMAINRERSWRKSPEGNYYHIKSGE